MTSDPEASERSANVLICQEVTLTRVTVLIFHGCILAFLCFSIGNLGACVKDVGGSVPGWLPGCR